MESINIKIPKEVAMALKIPRQEIKERINRELAIHLYEQNILSFGKARQLAGLNKWEFGDLLGKRKIPRHYDKESLKEDEKFAKS